MNNVGYKLVANATDTKVQAPYLGLAIPKGSLAFANILTKMVESGARMTEATARYFLEAFYEIAAEITAEECKRISTGLVTIYPAITGSFASEDAAFDPAKNSLIVDASLSAAFLAKIGETIPEFAGSASSGTVKMHTVYDVASMTKGFIDGVGEARIAGINLAVPDGEDESLELWKADLSAKVADFTVVANDGGQRLTVKLAAPVEAGKYKIRLVSHGIDPTAPLTTTTLPVLVAALTGPLITSISQEGVEAANTVTFLDIDHTVTITGYNLADVTTDMVQLVIRNKTTGEEMERCDLDTTVRFTNTDTTITVAGGVTPDDCDLPDGDHCTNRAFFVVNMPDGTVYEYEFKYQE